jgi:hypothetical protein
MAKDAPAFVSPIRSDSAYDPLDGFAEQQRRHSRTEELTEFDPLR